VLITAVDYQANEVSQKCFKLHGHSGSSEFMGEGISIEHLTSGAMDEAPYTVLEIKLVPDYDRNGVIGADDYLKWNQGRIFRFWINDDEDAKSTDQYEDSRNVDIPGPTLAMDEYDSHTPDLEDDKVNGYRDLIDFTSVFMDISSVDVLPRRICDRLTFKLSNSEVAVKILWANLTKYEAGDFQRGNVDCCGRLLNESSYEASTEEVSAGGMVVPDLLVHEMWGKSSGEKGLVFLEGRCSAESPLELEVWLGDEMIAVGALPMRL
jgi:hypothetical protein